MEEQCATGRVTKTEKAHQIRRAERQRAHLKFQSGSAVQSILTVSRSPAERA